MKKIKCYSGDCYAFFLEVVERKRTGIDLITDGIKKNIKKAYTDYEEKYNSNSLATITKSTLPDTSLKQLKDLYSYKSKKIRDLRGFILANNSTRICPCCTIASETSTMDHIVPKEKHPEFSVNPLNLIPCCASCNSHKSDDWLDGQSLRFLNLYKDDIPSERYLYVKLTVINEEIQVEFNLQNLNQIDDDLFKRINEHYNRLELCQRFQEASIDIFSEINEDLQDYVNMPIEQVSLHLNNRAMRKLNKHGNNNWQGILWEAAANSPEVIKLLLRPQPPRTAQ